MDDKVCHSLHDSTREILARSTHFCVSQVVEATNLHGGTLSTESNHIVRAGAYCVGSRSESGNIGNIDL